MHTFYQHCGAVYMHMHRAAVANSNWYANDSWMSFYAADDDDDDDADSLAMICLGIS